MVKEIWKYMWGTSLSDFPELNKISKSYLEYLRHNLAPIQIRTDQPLIPITPDVLDYVSFVTLGPSLVNGLTFLRKVPKALVGLFLEALNKIPQNPQNWSGLIIKQLLSEVKALPKTYRSNITETLTALRATNVNDALQSVSQHKSAELGSAFLAGIIESKSYWDAPECTSAATNIVHQGFRETKYATILQSLTEELQVRKGIRREDQADLIRKWVLLESDIRNRAFREES